MTAQPHPFKTGLLPLWLMIGLMWALHVLGTGTALAIRSWDWTKIWAVATAPFAHGSWSHLINNTISLVLLGTLVALAGRSVFYVVTVMSALVSGLGVFIINSPGNLTLGASGIVFGYAGYLVSEAWWERRLGAKILKILRAFGLLLIWGFPLFIGLLPVNPMVSWQGHLCGLIGGMIAAKIIHDRP